MSDEQIPDVKIKVPEPTDKVALGREIAAAIDAYQPTAVDETDAPAGDEWPEHEWPADVVDEIVAAEAGAQRSVCNIPAGKTPAALAKALERRVEVNLAQHDGRAVRRVGGMDPEVRRLEEPYSKRVSRDTTDGGRQRSTSTN